ncbi:MAG: AI-2E family transporter [Bacteroidota bacterium]
MLLNFSIVQFLESYVLKPYVIGDKVDLHLFFVILVVIIGNLIWGIIGMILAIPLIAIVTVIFLHVPPLQPYGFLESNQHS